MGRVLLVVMNKDNAEGLRRCLDSLSRQVGCRICECFDVLILDGGSRDGSARVVEEFSSRYPCVKFKVQDVRGGVGPARVEAVRYAMDNGYEAIIWGDSENEYSGTYVYNLVEALRDGCDIVSGRSVVRNVSIWSRMLYWYHSFHVIFSFIRRTHAPGNNEATRTGVFNLVTYPPVFRGDDFYFSLLALMKGRRFCYRDDAVVKVSMPKTLKEVTSWQRARMRGVVEGALVAGLKLPVDFPLWSLFALSPAIAALLIFLARVLAHPLVTIPVLLLVSYLVLLLFLAVKVGIASRKCFESPTVIDGLLALAGMYIHAVYTLVYGVKFMIELSPRKNEVLLKAREVLRKFDFPLGAVRLRLGDVMRKFIR